MVQPIAIFMLVSVAKAQKNLSTVNRSCRRANIAWVVNNTKSNNSQIRALEFFSSSGDTAFILSWIRWQNYESCNWRKSASFTFRMSFTDGKHSRMWNDRARHAVVYLHELSMHFDLHFQIYSSYFIVPFRFPTTTRQTWSSDVRVSSYT